MFYPAPIRQFFPLYCFYQPKSCPHPTSFSGSGRQRGSLPVDAFRPVAIRLFFTKPPSERGPGSWFLSCHDPTVFSEAAIGAGPRWLAYYPVSIPQPFTKLPPERGPISWPLSCHDPTVLNEAAVRAGPRWLASYSVHLTALHEAAVGTGPRWLAFYPASFTKLPSERDSGIWHLSCPTRQFLTKPPSELGPGGWRLILSLSGSPSRSHPTAPLPPRPSQITLLHAASS